MTTYTNPYTGQTINPSQVGYESLTISADTYLQWPINGTDTNVVANILEVSSTASGKKVYYNTYPFQKDKADVNTCGRHSVVRCLYAPYSLAKYKKVMDSSGMTPDNFVSALTAEKLGK